jgi:hypothetical protein
MRDTTPRAELERSREPVTLAVGGVRLLLTCLAAALIAVPTVLVPSAIAATDAPLPEADYAIAPLCAAPLEGHAGCLALELEARAAAARAKTHPIGFTRSSPILDGRAREGADGLRPIDLQHAYFPAAGEDPDAPAASPQTIALVDAYNDYEAAEDLAAYSTEFGIPQLQKCASRSEDDCFEQVNQHGEGGTHLPFPRTATELSLRETACESKILSKLERESACAEIEEAESWSVEISTDIEVAHAICQDCKVVLVEAESTSYAAFGEAEDTAVALGAEEISNSWGGGEPEAGDARGKLELEADASPFRHPGTVITASAGDAGYLNWTAAGEAGYTDTADFPASSPDVVAVGGTRLTLSDGVRTGESVWNEKSDPSADGAAGGGCSNVFEAQAWQAAVPDWSLVGCGTKRAVSDVAADADPYTGVAVYDSMPDLREERGTEVKTPLGWLPIGGTSVASPIVASMFALAGGAHGVQYPAQTLYSHLQTSSLHEVSSGGNGDCDGDYVDGCSGSLTLSSPVYAFDCGEGVLVCNAAPACGSEYYAGPTGVGSPNGIAGFEPGEQPPTESECSANGGAVVGAGTGNGSSNPSGSGTQSEAPVESKSGETGAGASSLPPQTSTSTGSGASGGAAEAQAKPRLLSLALTRAARFSLRRARGVKRSIAFSFTLSAQARVAVKLVRHVGRRVRLLRRSPFAREAQGHDWRSLSFGGTSALAAGRYTLTLELSGGGSRSVSFGVR